MTAATRASTLRAVLAAAAAALAACSGSSLGPVPPPPPACKGMDQPCGAAGECCSGDCPGGACGCSALAEPCGTSADCCDVGTPRRCEAGTCAAGARPLGDVCDWDGQCASLNCDLSGHCAVQPPPCLPQGSGCTSSQQCCSFMGCGTGTCSYTCQTSGACTGDNQCCSGYGCRGGQCQAGACGTSGQACATGDDCCTAAEVGKNYFCNASSQCDIGYPGGWVGAPPEACATDADCYGTYPCRGGYCHWRDGTQPDGAWCLDGRECDSGICTSSAAGVPGVCCSGAGAACTAGGGATRCCAPYTCTGDAGAQSCGSCLDFTNSGDGKAQCTTGSQCCAGRSLTCVAGECCTQRGAACTPGSGDAECCFGQTCGDVTTWSGTTAGVCCGAYGGTCGAYGSCCDGLVCTDGICLKAPGEPCTGAGQCGGPFIDWQDCRLDGSGGGTCCSHPNGDCTQDSHCCSGDCDEAFGSCRGSFEYGACLTEADCYGPDYNQEWSGRVCGGNASVGAERCCPVPGDTCLSAADCCEAGDSCKVPLYVPPDTASPGAARCCREAGASASQAYECCTGAAERRSSTSVVYTCCAYRWMTTFTCATSADCCDGVGTYATSQCGDKDGVMRCCGKPGARVGVGNDALCCSGRADRFFGDCQ